MKDYVQKKYPEAWLVCKLEDDGSLTFEEHDYRQGGVILSKKWKAYGERNEDRTPIDYEKDVKELLKRYEKEEPSYYDDIVKMLRKNEIVL